MTQNHPVSPESSSYLIRVGDTALNFREIKVKDPVLNGRQIIEAAGFKPPTEFVVLQWLADGDLEELDLEETVDIRERGVERFIIAKASEKFNFEIDEHRHEWPDPTITREVLLALAKQDPAKFSVWQEFKKGADQEILTGHPAKLEPKGVERFYTVMKHTTEG